MSEVKKATNSLAKGNTGVAKKDKNIYDIIKAGEQQFAAALPKHLNSERFTRVAITEIRKNPKLAGCKAESLLGSLMVMAQLGLEPGPLGQCYLIPYGLECQFQLSYKGMIELLRRTGQLSDIYAYTVFENDDFSIEYGLDRKLTHKPNFKDSGEPIGYYAVAILKDGAKAFEFMTKEAVEAHMKRFSKTYNNGPWKTDFEAMAHKTVVKKLLKWLPVSVEFIENMRKDEQVFKLDDKTNEVISDDNVIQYDEDGVVIVQDKPSTEDMQLLMQIAQGNNFDVLKKAKELYGVATLDDIDMEQYKELKELSING